MICRSCDRSGGPSRLSLSLADRPEIIRDYVRYGDPGVPDPSGWGGSAWSSTSGWRGTLVVRARNWSLVPRFGVLSLPEIYWAFAALEFQP